MKILYVCGAGTDFDFHKQTLEERAFTFHFNLDIAVEEVANPPEQSKSCRLPINKESETNSLDEPLDDDM